jgi:hypothetical protein
LENDTQFGLSQEGASNLDFVGLSSPGKKQIPRNDTEENRKAQYKKMRSASSRRKEIHAARRADKRMAILKKKRAEPPSPGAFLASLAVEASMNAAMEASASKDDYDTDKAEDTDNAEDTDKAETAFFEQLDETIKEGVAAIEEGKNFVKDKEPADPKRKPLPVTVAEAPSKKQATSKPLRKSPRPNKGKPAKKLGDY